MNKNSKNQKGFTLIELIVVLSILAILVVLAIPSFESIFNNNRLTANANEMLSTVQLSRMEAVRRNERIVICRSDNPDVAPVCNAAAGDWPGWLAFADDGAGGGTARDGVLNGGETVLNVGTFNAPLQLQASPAISAGSQRIIFRPDGLAYSNAGILLNAQISFCIPVALPPENVRDISIASGARIVVARRNGAGACVAPADS
jgi:type IV fimbrial biogenesis protein FimT